MNYQVVLIEPGGSTDFQDAFCEALEDYIGDLGLDPAATICYLDESTIQNARRQYPTVGVYFGGPQQSMEATKAAEKLMGWSAFVLPLVRDITQAEAWTPEALHILNIKQIDAEEPDWDPFVVRILEALGLIRERRQIFISYMRGESRGVALQLFHALQDYGFEAFLDTHSIQAGKRFQFELWDRMNDCDLIILLDTENARSRKWVAEEIVQAKHMGLGIVQLIWPGVVRDKDTDICDPQYLSESDLVDANDPQSALTEAALARVMSQIERQRARSFNARRTRLIEHVCRLAGAKGLTPHIVSPDRIDLEDGEGKAYWVLPVIGHLHSDHIEKASEDDGVPFGQRRLLFDDQGQREDRLAHLRWLNDQLQNATPSIPLKAADEWVRNL